MRVARVAPSMMPLNSDWLAKRASPPGTSDCSGSQYLAVPLNATLLTPARRSAPPIASTARLTRFCSRLGVAQEATRTALHRATRACFMGDPPRGWGHQPRRTGSRRQLFLLGRLGFGGAAAAGGGAGLLLRGGGALDQAELGAADAPVAVAVDRDPVADLGLVARQLLRAEVAVMVAVEAVEQGGACAARPIDDDLAERHPGAEQHGGEEEQPLESGKPKHAASIGRELGQSLPRPPRPISAGGRGPGSGAGGRGCGGTAAAARPTGLRCPCGRWSRGRRRSPTRARGRSRSSARPAASRRSRRSSAPRSAWSRSRDRWCWRGRRGTGSSSAAPSPRPAPGPT